MGNINFYVMRHGKKNGNDDKAFLTSGGTRQVENSAVRHFLNKGITFEKAVHSGLYRAYQTVNIVLVNLQQKYSLPMEVDSRFYYYDPSDSSFNEDEFVNEYLTAMARILERKNEEDIVVQDLLDEWPETTEKIRSRFIEAMQEIAREVYCEDKEINVLVGAHMNCSIGTPTPETTKMPKEADIVKYELSSDGTILSCTVL